MKCPHCDHDIERNMSLDTLLPVASSVDAATEAEDFTTGGEFVALVEKAVRRDGSMPIKIIQPGRGSSGFYPAAVLERDGPKVFTKGLHMYVDHPTATEAAERPERSLRDLAATLTSDARWDAQGAAGPGLYADAKVAQPWQSFIEELAPHIGVSIRAQGRAKMGDVEGEPMRIIEELISAQSVDLVTAAGAGGQILSLFESARDRVAVEMKPTYMEASMASDQELKEARDSLTTTEALLAEATAAGIEKDTELARLREGQLLTEARAFVVATLPTDLPELTHARLMESLSVKPVLKDGTLDKDAYKTAIDEAVKAEVAYLAKVTGSGRVTGNGDGTEGDSKKAAAEAREARLMEAYQKQGYTEDESKRLVSTNR